MEIRQLRALIAVADTGSVTKAAGLLHVVQPAVTKQIRMLESELGVELFERSRSGMRLNDSGRQVMERARRALGELDRAREEARSGTSEVRGHVSVGLLPSTATLLAPHLVDAAAEQAPGVRLRISVGYAGHLAQWLEAGDIDLALLFEQPMAPAYDLRPLVRETLWAVAPPDAGLSPDSPIALDEVLSHPLILPPAPHGLRILVDAAAADLGVSITVPVETNDSGVQRLLAADGHGWTVLPSTVATSAAVCAAPIDSPPLTRTIGTAVARRPQFSRATDLIGELLREVTVDAAISGRWPSAEPLRRSTPSLGAGRRVGSTL